MTTVVEIPEGLERALEVFRPHFGAPAFEPFKHYVLGLIVSENLGGDVGDHVNKALERYMGWLQGQEGALVPEPELVDRQKVIRNG